MHTLSLDAAVVLTGISRSTLWRRVTDGSLSKGDKDVRGRATLVLDEVLALMPQGSPVLTADDVAVLLRADAGDAEAQADIGALFYVAGAGRVALHWLHEAAEQGSAEAMQWLGTACAAGAGGGGREFIRSLAERPPRDHVDRQGGRFGPPGGQGADGWPDAAPEEWALSGRA